MKTRMLFIRQRTSAINALRGLLAEFGFIVPSRVVHVAKLGQILNAAKERVPEPARSALLSAYDHIEAINERIGGLEKAIEEQVKLDSSIRRLMTIPGVGKITAASIRAFVPDATLFKSARHFSSWLGITPRSFSSGGKQAYGRISKRGNTELRTLLVVGAFTVVTAAKKHGSKNAWLCSLVNRKPYKIAAVAVANKTARTVWAILKKGGVYHSASLEKDVAFAMESPESVGRMEPQA